MARSAKHADRDGVLLSAAQAFEGHVLEQRGVATNQLAGGESTAPYLWRCGKPGTNVCSFWIAALPGCVALWGDIGSLMIPQWGAYDIAWLRGAIDSLDYVLGKSTERRDRFVPEAFAQCLVERMADDPDVVTNVLGRRDPSGPWDYGHYVKYVDETGDSELHDSVFDWSTNALWAWAALKRFCVLLEGKGRS